MGLLLLFMMINLMVYEAIKIAVIFGYVRKIMGLIMELPLISLMFTTLKLIGGKVWGWVIAMLGISVDKKKEIEDQVKKINVELLERCEKEHKIETPLQEMVESMGEKEERQKVMQNRIEALSRSVGK